MKILANLGKLKDGRTALVIENAYHPDYVIVSGFDEKTGTWDSGKYFDGNLTSFSREITNVNMTLGYDRLMGAFQSYVDNDYEAACEKTYVRDALEMAGIDKDDADELGFSFIFDQEEEEELCDPSC